MIGSDTNNGCRMLKL